MKKLTLILAILLIGLIACKKEETKPTSGTLKYEVICSKGEASGAYWAYNNVHSYSTSSGKWSEELFVTQGEIYTINSQGETENSMGTLNIYYQGKLLKETSIYGFSVSTLDGIVP